jgi:hypothetical protein
MRDAMLAAIRQCMQPQHPSAAASASPLLYPREAVARQDTFVTKRQLLLLE